MIHKRTDDELIECYQRLRQEHDNIHKAINRCKLTSPLRKKRVQWAGCLSYTICDLACELTRRGLAPGSIAYQQKSTTRELRSGPIS